MEQKEAVPYRLILKGPTRVTPLIITPTPQLQVEGLRWSGKDLTIAGVMATGIIRNPGPCGGGDRELASSKQEKR
jgi:hypothetical protein